MRPWIRCAFTSYSIDMESAIHKVSYHLLKNIAMYGDKARLETCRNKKLSGYRW